MKKDTAMVKMENETKLQMDKMIKQMIMMSGVGKMNKSGSTSSIESQKAGENTDQ